MNQIVRWWVAGLVTVVAFAAPTWICATLALPAVIKDPGIRWGIAGALGVAVAALAALWGHSFATSDADRDSTPTSTGANSSDTLNQISGGIQHGPIIQGRDFSEPILPKTAPPHLDAREQD